MSTPRREIIGGATLWLGDCRDVPFAPADCLLMDPPYRLTSGGKTPGGMSGGWMSDYSNDGAPVTCKMDWPEILELGARIAAAQSDAYIFTNDKNLKATLNAADTAGWRLHNVLVWDKIAATANRWYMKNLEFVAYLFRGNARSIENPGTKQLLRAPQIDTSAHPTEKPVSVCRVYLENSTAVGGLVADPFMGTGTTGVAALSAGRRFEGCEIEGRWFDVACRRLEAAARQGELFAGAK